MAESNRGRLAYIAEATVGVTPTDPALEIMRFTTHSLAYAKQTTASSEIRDDALISSIPVVSANVGGDINVEYSSASFNELIAAAIRDIESTSMTNGLEIPSFSIEESILDVVQYRIFRGMRVNTWSMTGNVGSIVTGAFGFMGRTEETASADTGWLGAGSRVDPNTNEPWNATSNVGTILVDDTDVGACFQGFDLNLTNNIRDRYCLGAVTPGGTPYGTMEVTGNLRDVFSAWDDLYDAMKAHADVKLVFDFTGAEGDLTKVTLPRVKLISGTVQPQGLNADYQQNIGYQALPDAGGIMIQVDYTAA